MSKKLRNRFIALVCLLIFIGLGVVFYVNWVVQRPFAVILFVTDNLNASTLAAARLYHGGADARLRLEQFPHVGLLTTHSSDFAVTDTAAAGTAMATGQKVNNRLLGVDAGGAPLTTLVDLARKSGRTVGLVTNGSIAGPSVAAFYAHLANPRDAQTIAAQLVDSAELDLILGGGEADLLPEHKNGRRTDGRDLMLEMRRRGYDIARNKSELENTPTWRPPHLLGIFAPGDLAFAEEIEATGTQPSLAEMVQRAILHLQFNSKGYLLVVDAGLVGAAARQNEGERTLREILALDAAVASAVTYAGDDALIFVAGRQAIGGMAVNGYPFRNDKGVAITGFNAQGIPSITWSTGPGFPAVTADPANPAPKSEPSAFPTESAVGTASDSLVVGQGEGAEAIAGFKDNTDIFRVIAGKL